MFKLLALIWLMVAGFDPQLATRYDGTTVFETREQCETFLLLHFDELYRGVVDIVLDDDDVPSGNIKIELSCQDLAESKPASGTTVLKPHKTFREGWGGLGFDWGSLGDLWADILRHGRFGTLSDAKSH